MVEDVESARIEEAITRKYAAVSRSPKGHFPYPTGPDGARALGYAPSWIGDLPEEALEGFCGAGNPFLAGPVREGEAILDVGCGVGVDLLVAARMAGPGGRACGIDLTPEMAERSRRNAALAGTGNVEVHAASAEEIPYGDATFDIVISNGVLNLSTRKDRAFAEIARVLRPGGRLQFADIVLEGVAARESPSTLESWSD